MFIKKSNMAEPMTELTQQLWDVLGGLIEGADADAVEEFIDALSPTETALVVSRLDEAKRTALLSLLSAEEAAEMLIDLPDEQAVDLIEEMPVEEAAAIVNLMPADEQADLLADLRPADAEAVLEAMPPAEAEIAREIMQYPSCTAGGLMSKEYLSYRETASVGEVVDDLKQNRDRYSDYEVQYVYIVNSNGELVGVLPLRNLLLAERETPIAELMILHSVRVYDDTSLDELAQLYEQHAYLGIPVVDACNQLVGVVRRSAVVEAERRREKNIFLEINGIIGGEELRAMPLKQRSFRRLAWLAPNIVLNILAASVIAMYQDTLEAVIALAVFLPIISDMSGCSGNQAVAVSIRELALGLIKPNEYLRVFLKEVGLGLGNGLVLGAALGSVAILWKGNLYLGLVVGGALALNTLLSVLLGGCVPLLLRRVGVDPALASGPILTTVTDMCGFFLVLSLASVTLPLIL